MERPIDTPELYKLVKDLLHHPSKYADIISTMCQRSGPQAALVDTNKVNVFNPPPPPAYSPTTPLHYTSLYARSIKYERKQEPEVTPENIKIFNRFAKMPNVIDKLVSMFAPKVIGHDAEKLGILRSLVGSPEGVIRGRIHTLLVGPPGVAKSMLTREAVQIKPSSRYVTAQNASGKGITAIIDKENDTTFLRLGAVAQARGALCGINEIGRMDPEDQDDAYS